GNCVDDDGDGLVDHEDPACCTGTPLTLALVKTQLVPNGAVSLDLKLPGDAARIPDLARTGLALQIRDAGGADVLCVHVPPLVRRGKVYGFHDAKGKVAGTGGIPGVTLRAAHADAVLHVEGRKVSLARPAATTLAVTVAGGGSACGSTQQTLRR